MKDISVEKELWIGKRLDLPAGIVQGIPAEWRGLMRYDADEHELCWTPKELQPTPYYVKRVTPEQLQQIEHGLESDRPLPPDGNFISVKDMPGYAAKNPAAEFYWMGLRISSYRLEPSLYSLRFIAHVRNPEFWKEPVNLMSDQPTHQHIDLLIGNDVEGEYLVYACQDGRALMRHAFKMMDKAVHILMSESASLDESLWQRPAEEMRKAWEQEVGRVNTFKGLIEGVETLLAEDEAWRKENSKQYNRVSRILREAAFNEPVCEHTFESSAFHCTKCGYPVWYAEDQTHENE